MKFNKWRYISWGIALGVSAVFLIISFAVDYSKTSDSRKTTILVNAPDMMMSAFEKNFEELKLDKDYIIQYTKDTTKANFVVNEGIENTDGELIAYSPIVSVFNSDEDLKEELVKKEILVTSEISPDYVDLDFNKMINEIISNSKSEYRIYYPSKQSNKWEEFYNFLLFTVNGGYYPNEQELENCNKTIEAFLNSKNTIQFTMKDLDKFNGFDKNSFYFMTYSELSEFNSKNGEIPCRMVYPKYVVYHSFYADFDETGKILYDSLENTKESLFETYKEVGYQYLRIIGKYHTNYSSNTYAISTSVVGDERGKFNGVQIPNAEIPVYKEEQ